LPAQEAIEWMKRTAGVDQRRVFLLGHSQGGELAPRIAKETANLAGIIVLAGPTRPMQDMLLEQYAYLLSLNPKSALIATKLESARRFKQAVEDPRLRADEDVDLPTGGTLKGAYFLDARGYNAPLAAGALACRILVLQGERDYQVRMGDFETWRQALHGKPGASFRSYPLLDHLFVPGVGASRPEEYQHPGHVDENVVRDIADWIVQTGP
jgi:pimeloyl-ACP methyl ester carboxylesterase